MKGSIFITGATGFVGRRILERISRSSDHPVYCLVRDPKKMDLNQTIPDNVKIVQGDLKQPSSYLPVLKGVDTVVHLAAVTGKSSKKEYHRVIARGTRELVSACRQSGVGALLHVSTIAVTFRKTRRYFYAHAKQRAEEFVRDSGLNYAILRPTIILGKGSPVFSGFALFAGLPVVPLFGGGGAKIQPVHVDDVARAVLHIVDHGLFDNTVIELGGPDILSIRAFMNRIHEEKKGEPARFIRFPMGLTAFALGMAEPLLYPILPFTLGQLATFRNDGTAEESRGQGKIPAGLKSLDEMIHDSLRPPSDHRTHQALENECRVFCRYLMNEPPSPYVVEKYLDCHRRVDLGYKNRFDRFLLNRASKRPLFTKLCDSYSRFFYPRSLLAKKLIYLLAILETSPHFSRIIDRSDEKGKIWLGLQGVFRGVGFALSLITSFFFLLPFQVLLKSKKMGDG